MFGGDHAHTVANGNRCVKMDPITILTVMGMATERLGVTFSTTYFEPFHVARDFATLDLVTDGRAAWNIVTSMNDQEASNMGHASHIPGAYEDFTRLFVPELQRRGLFHTDYAGATVRENLGLDRSDAGSWR